MAVQDGKETAGTEGGRLLEFSWPSSLPCWGPGHQGMARSAESTNTGQGSFPPEPDSALQTKALLLMQR